MGIYYMIINESKQEYLYFDKYNLGVKTFMNPTRALILAWIMECSDWRGDNIRMIEDSGDEDLFYEISDKWKNREDDFIMGYKEYMDDKDAFSLFGVNARQSQPKVSEEEN